MVFIDMRDGALFGALKRVLEMLGAELTDDPALATKVVVNSPTNAFRWLQQEKKVYCLRMAGEEEQWTGITTAPLFKDRLTLGNVENVLPTLTTFIEEKEQE